MYSDNGIQSIDTYHSRFTHLHFYSTINFGSNHCGSSLHLNIMNDVSSAILDMDTVRSFTCLFDGFVSSAFRRRVLRVSWMERNTNISIIENIKPEWTLESRVTKDALSYFGHVVRAGGMEDDVMLGRMNGARKRGIPRQIWVDTLTGYAIGATVSNMRRDARDRARWRGATTAVAMGRMRLDGTR